MRAALATASLLACAVGACGGEEYVVITVESRAAVYSPQTLTVTLSNEGSEIKQTFDVAAATFPTTFSVSPAGRTGVLGVLVEAYDAQQLLHGRGTADVDLASDRGLVRLDTADFVVNTDFAGGQTTSTDFEAQGFQVAASAEGTITVTYRDSICPQAGCDIYARRFEATGKPLMSQLAAGTNAFKVSSRPTSAIATSAVASAGAGSIAVWDFADLSPGTGLGVACRSLDASGNAAGAQTTLAADTSSDVVSATPLSTGNYIVSWSSYPDATDRKIRGIVVRPDCTPQGGAVTVSTTLGALDPARSAVAANGNTVMFAWILDGAVRVRPMGSTLASLGPGDIEAVPKTETEKVEHVRIAPYGTGFALVIRWALVTGNAGPGRLELVRLTNMGMPAGGRVLVSDRSGSDFESKQGFGVATRPSDGALLTVWHSCNDNGDGQGCGVFGRLIDSAGAPVGETFVVPTTTQGNQMRPSVAALANAFVAVWEDESGVDPDRSGTAVRARVLYPDATTPAAQ